MMDLSGKKLLVIGGAFQHCKIVEAAHDMGVIVYVVDYLPLEKAPAKKIADYHFEFNITDYESIIAMCQREKIDGVIATSLDACQKPYQEICARLNLPCFGNKEQYHILTDKRAFKAFGLAHGLDVIPSYLSEDIESGAADVHYPVLVKPAMSRGSRGQTICWNASEVKNAIDFAKNESFNGEVIIEQYMSGYDEFTMTYVVVDGEPILVRTGDRFLGDASDGLDKLCIAGISPSKYNDFYLENANDKVCRFIRELGIKNGPVFMQGFVDGNTVRFFDPGLRFPGIEYERMFNEVYHVDPEKALIEFALTGSMSKDYLTHDHNSSLQGRYAVDILVGLKPGIITRISGVEKIKNDNRVVCVFLRCKEGDEIKSTGNVNQRLCEIDVVCDSIPDVKEFVNEVYHLLSVTDSCGNEMVTSKLNSCLLDR